MILNVLLNVTTRLIVHKKEVVEKSNSSILKVNHNY